MAFCAVHSPGCREVVVAAMTLRGASPEHIAFTLSEESAELKADDDGKDPRVAKRAQTLAEWAAALLAIPTPTIPTPDTPAPSE